MCHREAVTSSAVLKGRRKGGRALALASGVAAISAIVVVGCTQVTGGKAEVNAEDAPAFRTSMAVSLSESEATSSLRESQRLDSLTTAAVNDACQAFVPSSDASVDAVNAYVDAFNNGGTPAAAAAEQAAVDALNNSADEVEASVNSTLPADVAQAMNTWVSSARAASRAIAERQPPDQFNAAIDQLNTARDDALALCGSG